MKNVELAAAEKIHHNVTSEYSEWNGTVSEC